jgi:site-specific DNA recombinase
MKPRGKDGRLRAARGRPSQPWRSNRPVDTNPKDWIYVSVPPLIDSKLFDAAHAQLEENRSRARQGRRRPGYLLQGLTCCARCGYAYYGKTIRQLGAGRRIKDFIYYRCSGSDAYRFGGEAICRNNQVQGMSLETAVWQELCELLRDPRRLEHKYEGRGSTDASLKRVENFKAQRLKLQHAMERLIDGFTEGLIDKEQFTLRMDTTKRRISDLDTRIKADTGEVGNVESLQLAMKRLQDLSTAISHDLAKADWQRKREIIRTLVQRIEIDTDVIKVVFRLTLNARGSDDDSVVVTLQRH